MELARDDFGMTEVDHAAISREQRRFDRINRLKAIWMVMTTRRGDTEASNLELVECITVKVLCVVCLLCWWRDPPKNFRSDIYSLAWECLDMGYWDTQSDGYGWHAECLNFYPSQFRVEIFGDGDSYY